MLHAHLEVAECCIQQIFQTPIERQVMKSSATLGDTPFLENIHIIGDAWDLAVRWLSGARFVVCAWMFAACFNVSRVAHVRVCHLCCDIELQEKVVHLSFLGSCNKLGRMLPHT